MRSLVAGVLVGALLAANAYAAGELHIYNYRGYTSPKLVEKFTRTYDVAVTIDEYETNDELIATLRGGGGDTDYDIVVPSDRYVQLLIEEGRLAETKPNQMANFKNVDPRWIDVFWDRGRNYSVPIPERATPDGWTMSSC